MYAPSTLITSVVLALGLNSGSVHAALHGRDLNGSAGSFEAYYDDDLDITWLADANYAKTSGYDADGLMNWFDAKDWAGGLSFVYGGNVYDDWRLPLTLEYDSSCGIHYPSSFTCKGSEMGHLFFSELGGTSGQSILNSSDADVVKFNNLQADFYWSATNGVHGSAAWFFNFSTGEQSAEYFLKDFYALAVSPGDVAAVPEADTWVMLLAGVGLVVAAARRRRG